MSDRVLPARLALLVEREVLRHVLVDLTQGQLLFLPTPAGRAGPTLSARRTVCSGDLPFNEPHRNRVLAERSSEVLLKSSDI